MLIPPLNVLRAVKVFAVYVFGIVVEELMYEFTLESPYVPTQVPLIEKQPAVRLIPFANVDDAVVELVFNIPAVIPPV